MRPFGDDRAVRNVIGYTLTFAVILTSVGLVASVGYTQLGTISESERAQNGERAMGLIADNFGQLERQRSSVQVQELDMSGGVMSIDDSTGITVRSTRNFNQTIDVRSLHYSVAETTFTYENGALLRSDARGNSVVLSGPQMTCTPNRAIVSVVTIDQQSDEQIGGDVVTVTGTLQSQELLYPLNRTGTDSDTDATEANVTVNSQRDSAWGRYLTNEGNWTESSALDDTYVCENVDEVYVRRSVVSVSFLA